MDVSATSSATSPYLGDGPEVDANTTPTGQAYEGKAGTASGAQQSSVNNKIKMFANQHMSAEEIAQQLGISVTAVVQLASTAGINLNAGSPAALTNPFVGNKLDIRI